MAENAVIALFGLLLCLDGWALRRFAQRRRKAKAPARWPQLLAGDALVLGFLLALTLLGGALYYRFLFDPSDSMWASKTSRRWLERYWSENPLRGRGDLKMSFHRTQGKRRISFIGDSFTAGHGIKREEDRFVNIIRRTHPEWEVHMLAQPGLDTSEEIETLQKGLQRGYELDQVVLVYCLNDISDLCPEKTEAVRFIQEDADHSGWLRRNSYFVNTLYYRWQANHDPRMKGYFDYILQAHRGPLWQEQQQLLKYFRDVVQSHGGRLLVVTFPFLHALGPRYQYRFIHEQLGRCWRDLNVPHLDLLSIYEDIPPRKLTVNRFDAHPNEHAHALAAAAIDAFLAQ